MVFKNSEELKNYILTHGQVAVEKAKERVANIINHFLLQYYREFEPEVYVRTYQLLQSLVKSDVKFTGNGWVAEVYFDLSKLNYTAPGTNWSSEQVLNEAMVGGTHGGYKASANTKIWTESMNVLNAEAINTLKEMLISEGIPIK